MKIKSAVYNIEISSEELNKIWFMLNDHAITLKTQHAREEDVVKPVLDVMDDIDKMIHVTSKYEH